MRTGSNISVILNYNYSWKINLIAMNIFGSEIMNFDVCNESNIPMKIIVIRGRSNSI